MNADNFMSSQLDNASRTAIEVVGTMKYIGTAKLGALRSDPVWSIFRVDTVGGTSTDIEWAEGNADFNKIMDNYASYTYS